MAALENCKTKYEGEKPVPFCLFFFSSFLPSFLFLTFNWNIVDVQYYVSFRCTVSLFNIFTHYVMITTCPHTKSLQYSWTLCCTWYPCGLFHNRRFVPFTPQHLFHPLHHFLPILATTHFSLYLWICFHFVFQILHVSGSYCICLYLTDFT